MFNPGKLFAALARHGMTETAVLHLDSGDVSLEVGVKEAEGAAFNQFSFADLRLEFSGSYPVEVETRISFRGELYIVQRPPVCNGFFTKLDLQKAIS